jgi:hypothetical protein
MVRKLALIAVVASAGVVAAMRRRKGKDEQIDLWREATSAAESR